MRTQDLTPEQRRELLAAWDAAVRLWWSDRDINAWIVERAYNRLLIVSARCPSIWFMRSPDSVAFGF